MEFSIRLLRLALVSAASLWLRLPATPTLCCALYSAAPLCGGMPMLKLNGSTRITARDIGMARSIRLHDAGNRNYIAWRVRRAA
jgi:hypothetical protein